MENSTNDRIDVCVYLCHILERFGELPESVIGEIILSASPSDYFDVMGNIGFMLDKGIITENKVSGENLYSLTDEGRQIAESLSTALPPTLKERTETEGERIVRRNDRERSLRCDIVHNRQLDRYDLNVKFLNELNGDTILDLTLYAPDEKKAVEMRERFLSKPSFIITRIMNMFLKDDFFMFDK
ncbi:MAG: DUF4364 family protein [Ruminiclostridium sp.]|nr:DUF4364 family protein [Ruminiclostridium sp.]